MRLTIEKVQVKNILTRTSGYLEGIASHSLQPYRGCSFGRSLCGVGCYVQHNPFLTRGRTWGEFLEVRTNAVESYRSNLDRERRYAQRSAGEFAIFMSSATDPFLPQESRFHISASLLETMVQAPPDCLILQTHSAGVKDHLPILRRLNDRCRLRVHISIESDLDRLPGLPPSANPVRARMEAAACLKKAGVRTVITVAPLLPIAEPERFFRDLAGVSDALVLDHFVGGDGSHKGARTLKTGLPQAMEAQQSGSSHPTYLDRMLAVAHEAYDGPIGVGRDGFAARYRQGGSTA